MIRFQDCDDGCTGDMSCYRVISHDGERDEPVKLCRECVKFFRNTRHTVER